MNHQPQHPKNIRMKIRLHRKNEPQRTELAGESANLKVEETEHAAAVIEPSKTEAKSDHGSANQHSNEGVRSGKPAGWAFC